MASHSLTWGYSLIGPELSVVFECPVLSSFLALCSSLELEACHFNGTRTGVCFGRYLGMVWDVFLYIGFVYGSIESRFRYV